MRRRISIWGCVRPSVGSSVHWSVGPSICRSVCPVFFRRLKERILGASCAVYPALFFEYRFLHRFAWRQIIAVIANNHIICRSSDLWFHLFLFYRTTDFGQAILLSFCDPYDRTIKKRHYDLLETRLILIHEREEAITNHFLNCLFSCSHLLPSRCLYIIKSSSLLILQLVRPWICVY